MAHSSVRTVLVVAIVTASPLWSLGQAPEQKDLPTYRSLAAPTNLQLGALPTTSRSSDGSVGEVLLEGTTDEKTGTASLGWKNGRDNIRFLAKAPLDKKSKEASPLSLDGLRGDATVELSFSRFEFQGSRPSEITASHQICAEARRLHCQRSPDDCPTDPTRWSRPCPPTPNPAKCANLSEQELQDKTNQRDCKPAICRKAVCDHDQLPPHLQDLLADQLHPREKIWFWGGSITAGRSTFDYLDSDTLDSKSEIKPAWAFNARIGYFSRTLGFLIGSYAHSKEFRAAGSPQQICKPIPGKSATSCNEAVIGVPTERKRSVLSGEVRHFFASGAAIVPTFQYDLENDVTLVALPVYFLKNKDGAATGGVRFAWRSDTDTATLSIFVGAALRLD